MKIKVKTTDGYAEKVIVEYTSDEWSVTARAVKMLRNMSNSKEEVDAFDQMLNTEPKYIEVKDTKGRRASVLDKIRAEIELYEADCRLQGGTDECEQCNSNVFGSIYRIIDKYKKEESNAENSN